MEQHKYLVQGPVTLEMVSREIALGASWASSGAQNLFLGQIRSDEIEGKKVVAIEYSAYESMAEKVLKNIHEEALQKFEADLIVIRHSLGQVKVGEASLLVIAVTPHRAASYEASRWVVEEIKEKVPIFGKEMLEDDSYSWKVNK